MNEHVVLAALCESLDKDSDNEFRAVATIKIGPIRRAGKGR